MNNSSVAAREIFIGLIPAATVPTFVSELLPVNEPSEPIKMTHNFAGEQLIEGVDLHGCVSNQVHFPETTFGDHRCISKQHQPLNHSL
jgi:hypothetical protein